MELIASFKYTDQEHFIAVLQLFDNIHKKYHDVIYNFVNISPTQWFPIRRSLLQHIGLAILLRHLHVTEDMIDENLNFLNDSNIWQCPKIDFVSYESELRQAMQDLSFYANDNENNIDKTDGMYAKIVSFEDLFVKQDLEQLLDVRQGKKKQQQMVSVPRVEAVMMNLKLEYMDHQILSYLKDLELKVFMFHSFWCIFLY
jgi:hypothetical protein